MAFRDLKFPKDIPMFPNRGAFLCFAARRSSELMSSDCAEVFGGLRHYIRSSTTCPIQNACGETAFGRWGAC